VNIYIHVELVDCVLFERSMVLEVWCNYDFIFLPMFVVFVYFGRWARCLVLWGDG
jgi:hypothetical protein